MLGKCVCGKPLKASPEVGGFTATADKLTKAMLEMDING